MVVKLEIHHKRQEDTAPLRRMAFLSNVYLAFDLFQEYLKYH